MSVTVQTQDGRRIVIDGDSARIGSDELCEISFANDQRVHAQHALIKSLGDRWLVEAVGSASIQVGNSKPSRMGWLKSGDAILLSESGPTVVFEPSSSVAEAAVAAATSPVAQSEATERPHAAGERIEQPAQGLKNETNAAAGSAATAKSENTSPLGSSDQQAALTFPRNKAMIIASGIGATLLVGLIAVLVSRGNDNPKESNTSAPTNNSAAKNVSVTATAEKSDDTKPQSDPSHALYWVLVKDVEEQQVYRVGTAWAAAKHELVTSGSIAQALNGLLEHYPNATVRSPVTGHEFDITNVQSHPRFVSNVEKSRAVNRQHEEIKQRLEADKEARKNSDNADGQPEKQELLTDKQVGDLLDQGDAFNEQTYQLLQRQAFYDVGVIRVRQEMTSLMTIASEESRPRGGNPVSVIGLPFDHKEVRIFHDEEGSVTEMDGRIVALPKDPEASSGFRLAIQVKQNHLTHNWFGSAIVNSNREVIGVYSRYTLPQTFSEPPQGDLLDGAPIAVLRDFAQHLIPD